MRVFSLVFVTLALLGVFVVLTSQTVSPLLVQAEKEELISTLPLIRSLLIYTPASTTIAYQMSRVKNVSGYDVSLLDKNGTIAETTLKNGELKNQKLDVGAPDQTIFEFVTIESTPSFVLSSPMRLPDRFASTTPLDIRLAISEHDSIVGPFYDNLFSDAVLVGLAGLLTSAGLAFLFRRRPGEGGTNLKPAVDLKPVMEAFHALGRKDYQFRLDSDVGGPQFASSRIAFNKFMEEMSRPVPLPAPVFVPVATAPKYTPPAPPVTPVVMPVSSPVIPENIVRSRLVGGESERRAFQTALGSVEEGVLIVDHLGRIVVFNRRMEELSGFNADVVTNKVLTNVINLVKRGGGDVTSLIPRMVSSGLTEVFPEDTLLKRRDGTLVPVSVRTVTIKNDLRGAISHIVVIMTDKKPVSTGLPAIEKPEPAPIKKTFVPITPRVEPGATSEKTAQNSQTAQAKVPGATQEKVIEPPENKIIYGPHSDSEKLPARVSDSPRVLKEKLATIKPVFPVEPPTLQAKPFLVVDIKTIHKDTEQLPVEIKEELPAIIAPNPLAVQQSEKDLNRGKSKDEAPDNLPI